jgi:hypothetical protein
VTLQCEKTSAQHHVGAIVQKLPIKIIYYFADSYIKIKAVLACGYCSRINIGYLARWYSENLLATFQRWQI